MPTHIKFAGLRSKTLRSYGVALERFLQFVESEELKISSTSSLDYALGEYLNCMFWRWRQCFSRRARVVRN